jgi:transcription antitermination factor NusG
MLECFEPMFARRCLGRICSCVSILKVDAWQGAFRVAGVYGIACSGRNAPYAGNLAPRGQVDPISCDDFVERLMTRQDDTGAIPGTTTLADLFQVGEQVRVLNGPFRDFSATIQDFDAKDVATVLVEIFGRSTPVKLEFSDFEKL